MHLDSKAQKLRDNKEATREAFQFIAMVFVVMIAVVSGIAAVAHNYYPAIFGAILVVGVIAPSCVIVALQSRHSARIIEREHS